MTDIQATVQSVSGGLEYKWENVTEADTPLANPCGAGQYTVTVEGAFGGGSIELLYGKEAGNEASIDSTNLTFSANGSYNITLASGLLLPSRSGGSSMDVTVYISAIPYS